MKFIEYRIKPLLLIWVVGSIFLYAGCTEEENASSEVRLISYGPSGVEHGQEISIIGENLDKVTGIIMPVDVEVSSSEFTAQTPTLIKFAVPLETTTGKVILKTPSGDIESKTNFGLDYEMVISSIPAQAKPGTNMTITGDFLKYVKEIKFAENKFVTEFVSQSRTAIVVKVPMDAQSGTITISDKVGTIPQAVTSEQELNVTLPAVTSLSPASIIHTGQLTITGTDLDLVNSITFTGDKTVTQFVSKSATQIVVVVPVGTLKGKLTLKQASPVNVVTSSELTIILPKGTTLTPKPAAPGTDITIAGTDLDMVAGIVFPGVPTPVTTFVSKSATQIVVTVPAGASNGALTFSTIHGFQTLSGVSFLIPGIDPSPLLYVFFDDAFTSGYGDWSWGTGRISDFGNLEQVKTGTKSWKMTFPALDAGLSWGGGAAVSTAGYTKFSFSVFGGPGTEGHTLDVVINDTWSGFPNVTIKEGQWTEFDLLFSQFPGANAGTQITRIILRSPGQAGTVWVDKVGFK